MPTLLPRRWRTRPKRSVEMVSIADLELERVGRVERPGVTVPCGPQHISLWRGRVRWWRCGNCGVEGYVIERPRAEIVDAARAHLAGHRVCRPRVQRILFADFGVGLWTWTCPVHSTRRDPDQTLPWGTWSASAAHDQARAHAAEHEETAP